MSWITITIDTLKEAKVAALIEACDSAALGESQDNRAAGKIQGVVDLVRNAIKGCPSRRVDEDETTIPAALRDLAVKLIIAELKDAIEQELTDYETDSVAWARRELTAIRSCDYPIETPDTPVEPEIESGGAVKVITKNPRPLSSDSLSGL